MTSWLGAMRSWQVLCAQCVEREVLLSQMLTNGLRGRARSQGTRLKSSIVSGRSAWHCPVSQTDAAGRVTNQGQNMRFLVASVLIAPLAFAQAPAAGAASPKVVSGAMG